MTARELVARSSERPLVVGHRGAAAYTAENTMESFEEAIRCGVDAVECDVHVSRDGELVVIHDDTLDRTTAFKGRVSDFDAAALRKAGVPTLAEFLQVVTGRAVPVIELKHGEGIVAKTLTLLDRMGLTDESILFSFNEEYVAEAFGRVFTVRLSGSAPSLDGCHGIGVHHLAIDAEMVRSAQDRGLAVFAWTVPPGEEVERLASLGVNFIITNHPREVREQLGNR